MLIFFQVTKKDDGGFSVSKAEPASTPVSPGSGPRHLAIDEANNRAYLINELQMTVRNGCRNI